jgi:hypothetical protein
MMNQKAERTHRQGSIYAEDTRANFHQENGHGFNLASSAINLKVLCTKIIG